MVCISLLLPTSCFDRPSWKIDNNYQPEMGLVDLGCHLHRYVIEFQSFRTSVLTPPGVGSIVCAAAPSANIFILGRVVCGFGTAALLPIGLEMLFTITTEDERPTYIALVLGVEAVASGLGPLIGAIFAEKLSFRWGFIANLPMIVGFGTLVFFAFNQQRPKQQPRRFWLTLKREFDLLGCGLFVASLLAILLGLQFAAQSISWKTVKVILCLSIGGVFGVAFIVQQLWGDREFKFIPASVTNREVILSLFLGFFSIGSERVVEYFLAFYLQVRSSHACREPC